ncbi:MAG: hypothetical protein RR623_06775 [Bacilli bacterium]
MNEARIDWLIELTDCLKIWLNIERNGINSLNSGVIILSYANLGALVEVWMKLFYCVYYNDYLSNAITYKNHNDMREPNNFTFSY